MHGTVYFPYEELGGFVRSGYSGCTGLLFHLGRHYTSILSENVEVRGLSNNVDQSRHTVDIIILEQLVGFLPHLSPYGEHGSFNIFSCKQLAKRSYSAGNSFYILDQDCGYELANSDSSYVPLRLGVRPRESNIGKNFSMDIQSICGS
jgi:hypothetical protein